MIDDAIKKDNTNKKYYLLVLKIQIMFFYMIIISDFLNH